jgi:hypothetical protein
VRDLPRLSVDLDLAFAPVKERVQSLAELEETRRALVKLIRERLTDAQRRFLLSFKQGMPEWSLLPLPAAAQLPAVQWKLINIGRMSKAKHAEAVGKLKQVLLA